MCTYVYILSVIRIFSFFVPLGPLVLIIVPHFPKKYSNAAMPWSGKNTVITISIIIAIVIIIIIIIFIIINASLLFSPNFIIVIVSLSLVLVH